jgi:transposase
MFEQKIAEEVTSDLDMLKLQQLYGIRLISPYALMAIIGDIKRFKTPKKLVAYIGLQPKVSDSGEKKYSGSITKTGRRELKAILVECAQAIIQYAPADHPLVKWAKKLSFRKTKNTVIIAVARKLVTAIWYILNGFDSPLTEINKMIKLKLKKHAITIGLKRRKELGYVTVSDFVKVKGDILLGIT